MGATKCIDCVTKPFCVKHKHIKLITRNNLDPCLWLNEHVYTSYRPTEMPLKMCFWSMFRWNNETINIWSHLIGLIYFSFCQYDTNYNHLASFGASTSDHIFFSLSLLGSQLCMLFSTLYHIFGCINNEERKKWLQLDVFGISCALLGVYLGGIYTSFYCFNDILNAYLIGLLFICAISLYIPFKRDSLDFKLIKNSRIGFLQIAYMTIIAFGIYPTIHWIRLYGGFDSPHVQKWIPSIISLYVLLAAAFFFYASLIPERISHGTFDIVGCSHQWWHLLILIALANWHSAGIRLLSFYYSSEDACQQAYGTSIFDTMTLHNKSNISIA
uniref:Progestin and adipoQ receptor family member 3 n=1 Tax=Parastrongyloides trichosuri TaxID=131310 RepID=A0A0N4ZC53_PARTI